MKKIYLVVENSSYDYEGGYSIDAFEAYKSAKERYNQRRKELIGEAKEDNWIVDYDGNDAFTICEEGYYIKNHVNLDIVIKDINE